MRNAKLNVETEAGHAFVNLQVGLGQALLHPQPGGHRGGGPARERRREKRLAARQTAEEAVKVTHVENKKAVFKKILPIRILKLVHLEM